MAHTHDHPDVVSDLPTDDPEPGSTWFVSLAGTILFIALVLALAVMFFRADGTVVEARILDAPVKALDDMKAEQRQLLSDYRAYEEKAADGKMIPRQRIPIERAMELVAADLASKPRADAADAGRHGQ